MKETFLSFSAQKYNLASSSSQIFELGFRLEFRLSTTGLKLEFAFVNGHEDLGLNLYWHAFPCQPQTMT